MALIAMTASDTVDFVSDRDPSKTYVETPLNPDDPNSPVKREPKVGPGATVFKLSALDVFLMGYIYDNASTLSGKQGSDEVGINTRVNQTNIECVRHGLRAFTNFADRHGNGIRFKTQKAVVNGREYEVVNDAIMSMLGIQLIAELAEKIKEISEVSAAEEKNSEPASPQSGS